MNREITTDVLGFFDVIKIALAKVDNIKKSWIKPSASVKEIHFTHLDRLTDEGKIDFTKNIINATGYYKDNLLRGVQIKQQGGRLGYLPKDIELSFESDEQKRKYFGYKLASMGIEENPQEYAETEID
jgi:hypothetical protein